MTINVAEVRFYFSFTWIYILPTLRLNSSITYYTLIASPGYIIAILGEEHEPISYKLDLCVWYIRPVITLQRCTSSFVDIRPLLLDTLAVPGGGGYSVIRNPVKATISEHKSLLHEDSYRLGGGRSPLERCTAWSNQVSPHIDFFGYQSKQSNIRLERVFFIQILWWFLHGVITFAEHSRLFEDGNGLRSILWFSDPKLAPPEICHFPITYPMNDTHVAHITKYSEGDLFVVGQGG